MKQSINNRLNLLLILLLIITLIPVLVNSYFPSEDGPMHVHSALAYANYNNPDTPIYKEYYEKNPNSEPNLLIYLIIAFLTKIFNPVHTEKMLIITYVILMFISFKYLIFRISKKNGFILFLFFPFIMSFPIHLGFYNFSFSVIMFFITFGYWIEHYTILSWKNMFFLSLLTILIYFFHPVSLVMFYIASGTMIFLHLLVNFSVTRNLLGNTTKKVKIDLYYLFRYLLCLLPTIILFLLFLIRQGSNSQINLNIHFWTLRQRIFDFITLSSLYSFKVYELILSTLLSLIIFSLVFVKFFSRIKNPEKNIKSDAFLLISVVFLFIYLLAPDAYGGGMMLICRLLLFPFFILFVWLANFDFSLKVKKIISVLGILITISYSVIYSYKYAQIDEQIEEYVSCVQQIDSNSVILHLAGDQRARKLDGEFISDKTASFMNIGGRISFYKPVVELSNMVAWTGYGIIDYRDELNPERLLHEKGVDYFASSKNILGYPQISKGRIDYVLLWNYKFYNNRDKTELSKIILRTIENPDEETISNTLSQLNSGYHLIFTSKTGLLKLYKRNT